MQTLSRRRGKITHKALHISLNTDSRDERASRHQPQAYTNKQPGGQGRSRCLRLLQVSAAVTVEAGALWNSTCLAHLLWLTWGLRAVVTPAHGRAVRPSSQQPCFNGSLWACILMLKCWLIETWFLSWGPQLHSTQQGKCTIRIPAICHIVRFLWFCYRLVQPSFSNKDEYICWTILVRCYRSIVSSVIRKSSQELN